MNILIDSREKHPYKFSGATCTKLDTGDYSIEGYEHLLSIDRKATVSELAGNLTEKRFAAELERMSLIKHSYLLLEFSLDDILKYPVGSDIPRSRWRYLRIKAPFIIAALTKITLSGVHVIYAGDRDNAIKIITAIFKNCEKMYGQK